MEMYMMANGSMVRKMEEEYISNQVQAHITAENGEMENGMDMVY